MTLNFIQIASLIAIFQSCFLSIQLWIHAKNGSLKNRILSVYLFVLAVLIFCALTVTSGVEKVFTPYHKFIFVGSQAAYLLGPLLYLYIKINITNHFTFKRTDILHFAPFFIFTLLFTFHILPNHHFIMWEYQPRSLNTIFLLSHNFVYFILAVKLLKNNLYKNSITTKIVWLILVSFIVMWSIQLNTLIILSFFRIYKYCPHMTSLYSICTFLFINTIAYFASQKSEFYNQMNKYETSSLKNSELKQNKEKLIHLMEGQKPYLNPSLSLSDLANKISIPHRQLSQVINESFNQNFYDFVNTYRITECKRLLNHCSDEKKTIIEIAFEVGFNSKSTFNKAFKKHTGLTPKEYKKVRISTRRIWASRSLYKFFQG